MEEGVYSDFVILWLLCHQSRFDAERPEETIIENGAAWLNKTALE